MPDISTITHLLEIGRDDAVAITAFDHTALTYKDLRHHGGNTVSLLNRYGIRRNDRVALVLPNGPMMASAFVSIAAGATTAPLNPAYQKKEFDYYLADLKAKALVVEEDSTSPALAAAEELHIPTLKLIPQETAGLFDIQPAQGMGESRPVSSPKFAEPEDVALVLHTSGTTSRPKIVPLTHQNVCASAQNIVRSLALTAEDRCVNIMPLFHIHGLMAPILASFRAGASVYCTPGFNALRFFSWLKEAHATWYSAVPTMHQAILARASGNEAIIAETPLRLIRSSSASLPSQVMRELEEIFQVPVIETYAMTEASHQMTSNPLPPGKRKPGSVGMAAGPQVAIMDEAGALLPQGTIGEVVIQGANVTRGYENNPKANTENFTNGWFRTGDQGVMDEAGYLTLTGRLKEIINRGGEKISPREVDEVLMDHPGIAQVVTFAMPHNKLGEEVAAAVVIREGFEWDEGKEAAAQAIRHFAGESLAPFKVPRKIVFLDQLPLGPTGKLQRIGLAQKLGIG